MEIFTSSNLSRQNQTNLSSKSVLTRWLNEVTSFRQNYYLIEEYVGKQLQELCLSSLNATQHTSQCSLSSLLALQTEMRAELKLMLADTNECGQDLVKLKAHTLQLSKLNQQAQVRLMLSRNLAS